jgi:hypothetical protein
MGQRTGHRLYAPTRGISIGGRVPAPDPEAIPQGVTSRDQTKDRDLSRPESIHYAINGSASQISVLEPAPRRSHE